MMKSTTVTLLFLMLPLLCGCSVKMHRIERTLQTYEIALRVSTSVPEARLTIGQRAQIGVKLTNILNRAVQACTGPNTSYLFIAQPTIARDGRPPVSTDQMLVDHPTCERPFNLEAGEETTLHSEVAVPDIGSGAAMLHVALHVLAPDHCDPVYGCYGTMISAAPVAVELRR